MHTPDSHQITFANYALPSLLHFAGSADQIGKYLDEVGADNFLIMPTRTRITRQLLTNGRDAEVGVVRQTYRGERNFREVRDWLNAEELTPEQQKNKFAIAVLTYLAMQHKDASLDDVEYIASQHRTADIMYEITGRSIERAQRIATWENQPRRIVQLTSHNLELLIGTQEPTRRIVESALFDNGFTHLGYHSDSTPEVFRDNQHGRLRALSPLIMQYELTAFRTDLITGTRDDKDIERLANGEDSRTAQTINLLRAHGAQIDRVIYGVPGHKVTNLETRQNIIASLRRI